MQGNRLLSAPQRQARQQAHNQSLWSEVSVFIFSYGSIIAVLISTYIPVSYSVHLYTLLDLRLYVPHLCIYLLIHLFVTTTGITEYKH